MFSPQIVHWAFKLYNWDLQIWSSGEPGPRFPPPPPDPLVVSDRYFLVKITLTLFSKKLNKTNYKFFLSDLIKLFIVKTRVSYWKDITILEVYKQSLEFSHIVKQHVAQWNVMMVWREVHIFSSQPLSLILYMMCPVQINTINLLVIQQFVVLVKH